MSNYKHGEGTYDEGYIAGVTGASILIHPVKKEEDESCEEVSKSYKKYMLLDAPTLWEQGYMDGFNSVLEAKRKKKS